MVGNTLYSKTQSGRWLVLSVTLIVVLSGVLPTIAIVAVVPASAMFKYVVVGSMILLFASILIATSSLTVTVTDRVVALRFGIGLIRKTFPLDDIQSCTVARSTLLQGWGIHKIRGGWIYNISGRGAVEIRLKNGKRYLIGTADAGTLAAVINRTIKKGPYS